MRSITSHVYSYFKDKVECMELLKHQFVFHQDRCQVYETVLQVMQKLTLGSSENRALHVETIIKNMEFRHLHYVFLLMLRDTDEICNKCKTQKVSDDKCCASAAANWGNHTSAFLGESWKYCPFGCVHYFAEDVGQLLIHIFKCHAPTNAFM